MTEAAAEAAFLSQLSRRWSVQTYGSEGDREAGVGQVLGSAISDTSHHWAFRTREPTNPAFYQVGMAVYNASNQREFFCCRWGGG